MNQIWLKDIPASPARKTNYSSARGNVSYRHQPPAGIYESRHRGQSLNLMVASPQLITKSQRTNHAQKEQHVYYKTITPVFTFHESQYGL